MKDIRKSVRNLRMTIFDLRANFEFEAVA